jgi:FMN reductase
VTDAKADRRIVIVSAGASQPSTTRMLADRIAQASADALRAMDINASISAIEIAPLATDIAVATATGVPSEEVRSAIASVASADALVCSTPIYNAGVSGLFKTFVDVLDADLLIAKPVVLAATAGSARHALVVDEQMRSLFAYLRAMTLPTSLFAAPEDWGSPELGERIRRAATELAVLLEARVEQRIADRAWSGYQHEFGGNATRAQQTAADVDFDSPLMRLAAGGTVSKEPPSST